MFTEGGPEMEREMLKGEFKKLEQLLGADEYLTFPGLTLARVDAVAEFKKPEPNPEITQARLGDFWEIAKDKQSENSQLALSVITAGILFESGRIEDAVEELEQLSM